MFSLSNNGTVINMTIMDNAGGIGVFEFTLVANDTVHVQFSLPKENYRGVVAFNSSTTNRFLSTVQDFSTQVNWPTPSRLEQTHGHLRVPMRSSNSVSVHETTDDPVHPELCQPAHNTRRTVGSLPGTIDIYTTECFRQIDPIILTVAGTTDGVNNVPISVAHRDKGWYTAYFTPQEAQPISDEILKDVCDVISAAALFCPFVNSTSCVRGSLNTLRSHAHTDLCYLCRHGIS